MDGLWTFIDTIISLIKAFDTLAAWLMVGMVALIAIQLLRHEMKLHSPFISGVLRKDGMVLANQTVTLSVYYLDKKQKVTTTTNASGEFTFAPIYHRHSKALSMFIGLIAVRVAVQVSVRQKNKNVVIWESIFSDFIIEDSIKKTMANLDSELSNRLMFYNQQYQSDGKQDYHYRQTGYAESSIHGKPKRLEEWEG